MKKAAIVTLMFFLLDAHYERSSALRTAYRASEASHAGNPQNPCDDENECCNCNWCREMCDEEPQHFKESQKAIIITNTVTCNAATSPPASPGCTTAGLACTSPSVNTCCVGLDCTPTPIFPDRLRCCSLVNATCTGPQDCCSGRCDNFALRCTCIPEGLVCFRTNECCPGLECLFGMGGFLCRTP